MPSPAAAVFCTDKKELEHLVNEILEGKLSNVSEGKKWYEIVAGTTPTQASEKIWESIDAILER
jgi:hypothetical protein